jgi:hypothetical protein
MREERRTNEQLEAKLNTLALEIKDIGKKCTA